ncbi:MAG: class I and II aminotransferase [Deltaproteobacteria bacterium HGW-Deltaproteobacteria-6]|jgi:histidinol-phosphate/aromatic aminotransferase/cobyric acid decarboxylase-like protein/choline kinase|nr:MAG: class I and II aminotransferase [Deltaproteobacteria bacterium HGW-Deltaproteobacteria-6]
MKAVILAAGLGNRMRPLTDTVHKTLLKVGNESIIERIINGLKANGIKDIVVVTGYLADELKQYLLDRSGGINFTFVNNPRYRETNNIYSLALAFNEIEIDDDILLVESDLIYENKIIDKIINTPHPNAALLDKYRSGMDGTVVSVARGIITNIIPPHLQDEKFDFSDKYKTLNIYKFSREFCNKNFRQLLTYYARVIDDNCYYELILGILIYLQKEVIYAEILEGEEWSEVDDPNDLRVSEFVFNKGKRGEILETTFGGFWSHDIVDFCFIRNMYFPSSSMLSEIRNNLANLVCNYGSKQTILNQKLAYFLLCNPDHVNLLNGSSQIYPILQASYQNRKILLPEPTFGEYPRIFKNAVFYADKIGIDTDEIEAKGKSCDLVVFVNPNNPTGTFLENSYLHDYAAGNPEKTILVDESFIDFSGSVSMLELLEKDHLPNVIVLKSLSKVLGVPGIRLGFVYSRNSRFNTQIRDALPIWNSNSIAEFFIEIILKHRQSLAQSFLQTIDDRAVFAAKLDVQNFIEKVYPGSGNFILVKFRNNEKLSGLAAWLLAEHACYIKDVSGKFNDGCYYIRFAVRLPEENNRLVLQMQAYFSRP